MKARAPVVDAPLREAMRIGGEKVYSERVIEIRYPYTGELITVTLDHRFVSDFLKVLDGEKTVTVDIQGSDAAALFLTDDGYGYVVMPLARDK